MNIVVNIDSETLRRVDLLARESGNSRNALVNIAVSEFVRNHGGAMWPETVAHWLESGTPAKIRNFDSFEAHRSELAGRRQMEL